MHSRRMRTGRSLAVCCSLLPRGVVSAPGGCLLLGGWCLLPGGGGVSAPGGCLLLGGVCSVGGVCSWGVCSGVSAPGGVCSGGCLLPGGVLQGGVCSRGYLLPSMQNSLCFPCDIPVFNIFPFLASKYNIYSTTTVHIEI